jgi:hypothetical protein
MVGFLFGGGILASTGFFGVMGPIVGYVAGSLVGILRLKHSHLQQ